MAASEWDQPNVGSGRERAGVDLPTPSAGEDRSERGERLGRRWMLGLGGDTPARRTRRIGSDCLCGIGPIAA